MDGSSMTGSLDSRSHIAPTLGEQAPRFDADVLVVVTGLAGASAALFWPGMELTSRWWLGRRGWQTRRGPTSPTSGRWKSCSATPEQLQHQLDDLAKPTDEGEKWRAAFAEACAVREYAYQAHGVEMNQIYKSDAVVTDDASPFTFDRDPELYHQQTSYPGTRLPHCWVGVQGKKVSALDLTSPERFTLTTRIR